jgi:hypothetical protein
MNCKSTAWNGIKSFVLRIRDHQIKKLNRLTSTIYLSLAVLGITLSFGTIFLVTLIDCLVPTQTEFFSDLPSSAYIEAEHQLREFNLEGLAPRTRVQIQHLRLNLGIHSPILRGSVGWSECSEFRSIVYDHRRVPTVAATHINSLLNSDRVVF